MNGSGARAGFLFQFDDSDKLKVVLRTAPYFPSHLCAIDENTVWATGGINDRQGGYGVLREYSLLEGLKSELLMQSSLPKLTTSHLGHDGSGVEVVACGKDSVIAYFPEAALIVEHRLNDPQSLLRYSLPKISDGLVPSGFAIAESGGLFASITGNNATNPNGTENSGSGVFEIRRGNDGTAAWLPVANLVSGDGQHSIRLLGFDGDKIVFHEGRVGPTLHWATLQEASPPETSH